MCGRKIGERRPDGPFPLPPPPASNPRRLARRNNSSSVSAPWEHGQEGVLNDRYFFPSRSGHLDLLHALRVVHPILRSSCRSQHFLYAPPPLCIVKTGGASSKTAVNRRIVRTMLKPWQRVNGNRKNERNEKANEGANSIGGKWESSNFLKIPSVSMFLQKLIREGVSS